MSKPDVSAKWMICPTTGPVCVPEGEISRRLSQGWKLHPSMNEETVKEKMAPKEKAKPEKSKK